MRTRVKICGLTREADVRCAVAAGADAIGLVFHPASPRAEHRTWRAACARPAPLRGVAVVGLFVDAPPEQVRRGLWTWFPWSCCSSTARSRRLDCATFGRRWIKALRMRPGLDLSAAARRYTSPRGCCRRRRSGPGGRHGSAIRLGTNPLRAGGRDRAGRWTHPGERGRGIRRVRPDGVDVSGGVESAKGIKDREKILRFMQGVRDGEQSDANQ